MGGRRKREKSEQKMQRERQAPRVCGKEGEGNVGGSMRVAKTKDEREVMAKNRKHQEKGRREGWFARPRVPTFAVQQKGQNVQKGSRIEKKKRRKEMRMKERKKR